MATKRTYQPKKKRTVRKLGYRARMGTKAGRRVIKRRRSKGRKRLSISDKFRKVRKQPRDTKKAKGAFRKPKKKSAIKRSSTKKQTKAKPNAAKTAKTKKR